jgi:hypothetical protein
MQNVEGPTMGCARRDKNEGRVLTGNFSAGLFSIFSPVKSQFSSTPPMLTVPGARL